MGPPDGAVPLPEHTSLEFKRLILAGDRNLEVTIVSIIVKIVGMNKTVQREYTSNLFKRKEDKELVKETKNHQFSRASPRPDEYPV